MTTENNEVFIRTYELSVGDNKDIRARAVANSPVLGASDFTSKTLGAIEITSLRMKAIIRASKQNQTGKAPPCTISLYNASIETKQSIQQGFSVILKAGYETDESLDTLFVGQVVRVDTKRVGPDLVTVIICSDTAFTQNNIRVIGSLPPESTVAEVMYQMLDKLRERGIPAATLDRSTKASLRLNTTYDDGYAYDGPILTKLAEVAKEVSYRVYTSLGKVFVEPLEYPAKAVALIIKPENIKGQIQPRVDTSASSDASKEPKVGISITTFLDGRFTLTTFVEITERVFNYSGTYQPMAITHRLDTEGDEWDTEITLTGAEI